MNVSKNTEGKEVFHFHLAMELFFVFEYTIMQKLFWTMSTA